MGRLSRRLLSAPQPADEVVEAIRAFAPDLVVFSLGGTYDLVDHVNWTNELRRSNTRYRIVANWQTETPTLPALGRTVARDVLRAADLIAFLSARNLESTRRHLLDPLPNARVLQMPVRRVQEGELPWPKLAEWSMATVSRLEDVKGLHWCLHAAALALAGEPSWRINIYGRGPDESYLRDTIAYCGLSGRVHLRGYVGDLASIWRENHLLLSPAVAEGIPLTIPEALLCSRPALATSVGGADEWIQQGVTGFLAPACTVSLLAATLTTAWNRRDEWQSMGAGAHAAALARSRPDEYRQLVDA
jgi:hypothetical protein